MNIRMANRGDISNITKLVESLSHFYLEAENDELPAWLLDTLTNDAFLKRIQSDDNYTCVYELKNEIVGYLSFKGNSHLYHLFVAKDHQGKGISRVLWEYAVKICVSDVYTLRSSLFAVPIYERFGFTSIGEPDMKDGISFQAMEFKQKLSRN